MEYRIQIRDTIFDCPMALALTAPPTQGMRTICINPAFEQLSGLALHEVVGRDFRSFCGTPGGPAGTRLAQQIAEGKLATQIVHDAHTDGKQMQVLVIVRPFELGDTGTFHLAAKVLWNATRQIDPNHLVTDRLGRVRSLQGGYVGADASAELRFRLTLFNGYFRVIRAYVAERHSSRPARAADPQPPASPPDPPNAATP